MRRSALTLGALLLLATPHVARADEEQIIVQREPGLSGHERAELRQDAGVELVETLPVAHTELDTPRDGDVRDALDALRDDPEVVSAEADTPVHAASTPNDFYWSSLWALTAIDAPEAWSRGSNGDGVTVAVVDTGINATHDDLAGQIASNPGELPDNGIDDDHDGFIDDAQGWDFVSGDNVPQDGNGHGSHVAGTIAATGNNGTGLIGVAPQARILPVRALDGTGSGWMSDIAAAFAYAADRGAPIVSASLGGSPSTVLEQVIADHPNTLFVVAAGNEGADARDTAPCDFPEPNIVCVGASDQNDKPAGFSNFSATDVDLFAPGVSILSAWKDSGYRMLSGTSMATPHVAGVAALALSAHPGMNSAQLKWALLSSVDAVPALAGTSVTGGRLNADGAVAASTGEVPALVVATPTPTPTATPAPVETAVPAPAAPPVALAPAPAAPAPAAVATALSHVKIVRKGATLRVTFALNRAAAVRFSVTAHGKRVASWTRKGRAGANALAFHRKLKRGAYTLALGLSARATSARVIRVP